MATNTSKDAGEQRHPFGVLLTQYRLRKPGLTQTRLAELAGYDQAILVRMSQGKKDLTGPSGRERILRLIETLHDQNAIHTLDEANALLLAANLPPLFERNPVEAKLIARFEKMPAGHRVRRTNLPAPLAGFIGRAQEIADVRRLLKATRLLTLTGAGGVGKTRLAQQVAADVLIAYPDGVWYAELAALRDGDLIADAMARALGLALTDRPALEQVCDFLRERHVLLVLDNCEHLIDAVAAFAIAVLQAGPRVTVLTTSREALNVEGETTWRVPPMQPDEAAQLFVTRAGAVRGGAGLSEHDATVMHICQRLDGMPLAIELAAARLNALSLSDIAAKLDDRFTLLAHGRRGALPRHQTLRAMIDWSYELLSEQERVVFRRLGVFVGGWTLEDAAQVVAIDSFQAMHDHLIHKSLVTVDDAGGVARYHLLETLREYALEKLREAGELEDTQRRHAETFLLLAEASREPLHGPQQLQWLARLRLDYPNLQAAMASCLQSSSDALTGCRIVGALYHFWSIATSHLHDTRKWVKAARIALTEDMPLAVQAWILLEENSYFHNLPKFEVRALHIHDLFVQAGDPLHAALLKPIMGEAAFYVRRDFPKALSLSEEGIVEARALGADWVLRVNLWMLGQCLRLSQYDAARAELMYRESAALSKAADDIHEYARTLGMFLSLLAKERLDFAESLHCAEEALKIFNQVEDISNAIGMRCNIAENLFYLGSVDAALILLDNCKIEATERQESSYLTHSLTIQSRIAISQQAHEKANTLLKEALTIRLKYTKQNQTVAGLYSIVDAMAALASAQGFSKRAAYLRGIADHLIALNHHYRTANLEWEYAPYMDKARAALGDEAFDAAYAEGRAMPMGEAMAYALGEA